MQEEIDATDSKRERAWVYKQIDDEMHSKMIYKEDQHKHFEDGWKDSPAYWYDFKPHMDEDGEVPTEILGAVMDNIDGIVEATNDALNLDLMEREELMKYAEKHLGRKLNTKWNAQTIRKKIREELEKPAVKVIDGKYDNS